MKKIKILSLTLATLLLAQTNSTICIFGNLSSIFTTKVIAPKKHVKIFGFKLKKLIWPSIITGAVIAIYFATKNYGRADGSVDRENSGARIKGFEQVRAEEGNVLQKMLKNLNTNFNNILGKNTSKFACKENLPTKNKNGKQEMTIKNGILVPKNK